METKINASISTWTNGYFSNQAPLDECFGLTGEVKEHWKKILTNVDKFNSDELKSRSQELLKLLQENGVTYNVYNDDSGGLNRPWQLDTIPLVISKVDWRAVEKGMKQRAYVLNKLLEDLYGERTLLKEGIIPPELIYAHSGFLRPCDKVKLPGAHQLIFYAADLSRGPDDKVWVLRDRTQAPSGMGYALENRSALNRVLPELFKEHEVAKLGGFFNHMMQAFIKVAPQGKEQPRVVLLTPGPRNETYFEHAFLAYHLGFTLVQGEDLVVRNNFVWIKTVEGLEKVDIIIRRVDDSYCDPLELREDSQLGIPGLLEVIRKGNVAVVNPLGSSILENTGLMAFMHRIFNHFIKEEPIFPMVATWWCGQPKEMNYVIDHLDELVVKKIDRTTGSETIIGNQLSKAAKEDLIRKMKTQPYLYVGQEAVSLSTSPVFSGEKLEPRYTVLRSFMIAAQDGYEIMPGGLTRCSPEKGSLIVSNQEGGISKDTWVEAPAKVTGTSLLHRVNLNQKALLPSRAAENLFWVGRYTQRVVRTSRFIRIALRNLGQTGYLNNANETTALRALMITVRQLTGTYVENAANDELKTDDILNEIHSLICDADKAGSILFTVNNLLRATYSVRDNWSVDNWRIIDEIENVKRRLEVLKPENIRHVFSLLDQLNMGLLSFLESNRQSMYRGEGWIMYRIGQFIEEILLELTQYQSLLTISTDESAEFQILEAILVSNQSLSNYRSVYRTYFDIAPAIDLLFLNKQNPISILSQLEQLTKYLDQLPKRDKDAHHSELSNLAFECYSSVRLIDVDKLLLMDEDSSTRKNLDILCGSLADKITEISVKLSAAYFSHSVYQSQGKDVLGFEV
jgi:uncharacterized circularly permuted ATP-grasp superfamily protein/uncharacterized alpha-E superfamily protein